MATTREQIEHLEARLNKLSDKPWKKLSHSRKWLKKQMNRYLRRKNKKIDGDEQGYKQNKKPYYGYEY